MKRIVPLCLFALAIPVGMARGAAPTPEPPRSSISDAFLLAATDIDTVPECDRPYTRYLWVAKPTELARRVWNMHWNLLSRYSDFVRVRVVAPWLWRLNIHDTQIPLYVWEDIAKNDPFGHVKLTLKEDTTFVTVWPGGPDAKGKVWERKNDYGEDRKAGDVVVLHGPLLPVAAVNKLRLQTYSEAPVVMMEWLLVQSARQRSLRNKDDTGIGYYDFLAVPDLKAFFKLTRFSEAESAAFGREYRAAVEDSGVNPQGRQLGRGAALGGGAWFTDDTDDNSGRGNPLRNLKPGQFKKNTQEWYIPLPNGLPATFLNNDKGERQNVAPGDTHGLHDTSPANESTSKTLHSNMGCWNCHAGQVLKEFRDDVRKMYEPGSFLVLGSARHHLDLQFRKLYLSDIYFWLRHDQEMYFRAIREVTRLDPSDPNDVGLTPAQAARAYSRLFYSYALDPVTIDQAARELGVPTSVWHAALVRYARGLGAPTLTDIPLSRFLMRKPLSISRLTWEDSFPLAYQILAAELLARTTKGHP